MRSTERLFGSSSERISARYTLYGVLLWGVSTDVRRFLPLIHFLLGAGIGFGLITLGIDFGVGLPVRWTAVEGPFTLIGDCVFLGLCRSVERRRTAE